MHLTLQAVVVISNEKNVNKTPVNIAPITLVAANETARSINENRIEPKTPIIHAVEFGHKHRLAESELSAATTRFTPRYTIATPKTTHKKAGVTVIVAINVRKAVITPTSILPIIEIPVQLNLQ